MESLIAHYPLLRTLWVVWFFLLFVGIVLWAMRPAKRQQYEQFGAIPLRAEASDERRH